MASSEEVDAAVALTVKIVDEDGGKGEEAVAVAVRDDSSSEAGDAGLPADLDVMMLIGEDDMIKLHGIFKEFGDGLDEYQFVTALMRCLPPTGLDKLTLVTKLADLFAQIDANGDGDMEWTEFSNYCVEAGLASHRVQQRIAFSYEESHTKIDERSHSGIRRVRFVPELRKLLVQDGCSKVLKVYNTDMVRLFEIHSSTAFSGAIKERDDSLGGHVVCSTYIPDGNRICMCSSDLSLTLWDGDKYRFLDRIHTREQQLQLQWCTVTGKMFSSGRDGVVLVWDLARRRVLKRLHAHTDIIMAIVEVRMHDVMATAGMDGKVQLWDLHTLRNRGELSAHERGIRAAAYCASSDLLFTASFEFDALGWDLISRRVALRLVGHRFSLLGLEVIEGRSPRAVTGDVQGNFKLWDVARTNSGVALCLLGWEAECGGLPIPMRDFALVDSDLVVASAGRLHYFESQERQATQHTPVGAIYNPTTLQLIVAAGRSIYVWDVQTGMIVDEFALASEVTALILDDRQRKIFVGTHKGTVHVLNTLNGAVMKEANVAHHKDVTQLIYCHADKCVISGSWDRAIHVYDDMNAMFVPLLRELDGAHESDITCMVFAEQLGLIATGSSDYSVRVWDFQFMKLDGICSGSTSEIAALQFLPDMPLLCAADSLGTFFVWAVRPHRHKYGLLLKFCLQTRSPTVDRTFLTDAPPPEEDEMGSATVISMSLGKSERGSNVLITADEQGWVSLLSMASIISKCGAAASAPTGLARPSASPSKRRRVSRVVSAEEIAAVKASQAAKEAEDAAKSSADGSMPSPTELRRMRARATRPPVPLQPTVRFRAHLDGVCSVQYVEEPPSLWTSSFDYTVRTFSLGGKRLGSLSIATMKQEEGIPWAFKVDLAARHARKRERAAAMLRAGELAEKHRREAEERAEAAAELAAKAAREKEEADRLAREAEAAKEAEEEAADGDADGKEKDDDGAASDGDSASDSEDSVKHAASSSATLRSARKAAAEAQRHALRLAALEQLKGKEYDEDSDEEEDEDAADGPVADKSLRARPLTGKSGKPISESELYAPLFAASESLVGPRLEELADEVRMQFKKAELGRAVETDYSHLAEEKRRKDGKLTRKSREPGIDTKPSAFLRSKFRIRKGKLRPSTSLPNLKKRSNKAAAAAERLYKAHTGKLRASRMRRPKHEGYWDYFSDDEMEREWETLMKKKLAASAAARERAERRQAVKEGRVKPKRKKKGVRVFHRQWYHGARAKKGLVDSSMSGDDIVDGYRTLLLDEDNGTTSRSRRHLLRALAAEQMGAADGSTPRSGSHGLPLLEPLDGERPATAAGLPRALPASPMASAASTPGRPGTSAGLMSTLAKMGPPKLAPLPMQYPELKTAADASPPRPKMRRPRTTIPKARVEVEAEDMTLRALRERRVKERVESADRMTAIISDVLTGSREVRPGSREAASSSSKLRVDLYASMTRDTEALLTMATRKPKRALALAAVAAKTDTGREKKRGARTTYYSRYRSRDDKASTFGRYDTKEVFELKQIFDSLDTDGSGEVDINEFVSSSVWSDSEKASNLNRMFESLDFDQSGTLTIDELMTVCFPRASKQQIRDMLQFVTVLQNQHRAKGTVTKSKPKTLTESDLVEIKELFDYYDTDGSGGLSPNELMAALDRTDGSQMLLSRDYIEGLCSQYGLDGDTEITYEEFVRMVSDLYFSRRNQRKRRKNIFVAPTSPPGSPTAAAGGGGGGGGGAGGGGGVAMGLNPEDIARAVAAAGMH
eukprot:PLAT9620.1.p1 GENE.PLAT9620.1~~PLAT9620.1.p1  ORF type:complete len:1763 (-),score=707.77 PLAT9620.1:73-5361(-)